MRKGLTSSIRASYLKNEIEAFLEKSALTYGYSIISCSNNHHFNLGTLFCGWICPLGAVQELIHIKKIELPPNFKSLDRGLKFLKHLILAFLLYFTIKTGWNIFCRYDPFKALFNFQGEFITLLILIIILMASLLVKRPFCRYLCPFGAVLSFISRFSIYKIRLNSPSCAGCGACAKNICPMDALSLAGSERKIPTINHSECIQCGICIYSCHLDALKNRAFAKDQQNGPPINQYTSKVKS